MPGSAIAGSDYRKIREGDCSNLDVNGNPTPDLDASLVSEGTHFYALNHPAGISGDMRFRAEGGVWVWRWGSFTGSNAQGEYRRSADGTQRCSIKHTDTVAIDIAFGSGYINSQTAALPWPVTFYEPPNEHLSGWMTANAPCWISGGSTQPSTTQTSNWWWNSWTSQASQVVGVEITGIGRWKA
jgi:hypothetical protein